MIGKSVKEAWQINTGINRALLAHLTPEMMNAQTPGGGFSVAQHLIEIIYTPKYFGLKFDAAGLGTIPDLYEETADSFRVTADLPRIRDVAAQTADIVLASADSAEAKGDLPRASLDVYLIHMMAHDAHHRGQIMLALKTSGHPLPGDDEIWGPWKQA